MAARDIEGVIILLACGASMPKEATAALLAVDVVPIGEVEGALIGRWISLRIGWC